MVMMAAEVMNTQSQQLLILNAKSPAPPPHTHSSGTEVPSHARSQFTKRNYANFGAWPLWGGEYHLKSGGASFVPTCVHCSSCSTILNDRLSLQLWRRFRLWIHLHFFTRDWQIQREKIDMNKSMAKYKCCKKQFAKEWTAGTNGVLLNTNWSVLIFLYISLITLPKKRELPTQRGAAAPKTSQSL